MRGARLLSIALLGLISCGRTDKDSQSTRVGDGGAPAGNAGGYGAAVSPNAGATVMSGLAGASAGGAANPSAGAGGVASAGAGAFRQQHQHAYQGEHPGAGFNDHSGQISLDSHECGTIGIGLDNHRVGSLLVNGIDDCWRRGTTETSQYLLGGQNRHARARNLSPNHTAVPSLRGAPRARRPPRFVERRLALVRRHVARRRVSVEACSAARALNLARPRTGSGRDSNGL